MHSDQPCRSARCGATGLALRLLVCAVLGSVLTIAVSWSLAMWGRAAQRREQFLGRDLAWPVAVPRDWPRADHGMEARGFGVRVRQTACTGILGWPTRIVRAGRAEFGWPMHALRWSFTEEVWLPPSVPSVNRGIGLGSGAGPVVSGTPLTTVPRRHRLATRRGLCPRCGYPLAGLTQGNACPECGNKQP
jgi:hypothetical protein